MSMLSRYKKKGGFLQLVQLIETCATAKQEKLLENIQNEDPRWAQAVKSKLLSIEKIFTWDSETLGDITMSVQELTLALAFHGLSEEIFNRSTENLGHIQKKKIKDLMAEKEPSKAEIATAQMKLIEEVRRMITNGEISIRKVDPDLFISDDVEEELDQLPSFEVSSEYNVPEMSIPQEDINNIQDAEMKENLIKSIQRVKLLSQELEKIKQETLRLRKENHELKQKMTKAKSLLAA